MARVKKDTAPNTSTKAQDAQKETKEENTTTEENRASVLAGTYCTSTAVNVRASAAPDAAVTGVLPINTTVKCDGQYAMHDGKRYLYIESAEYKGYCNSRFLIKTM